jgi:hypothetical protein
LVVDVADEEAIKVVAHLVNVLLRIQTRDWNENFTLLVLPHRRETPEDAVG